MLLVINTQKKNTHKAKWVKPTFRQIFSQIWSYMTATFALLVATTIPLDSAHVKSQSILKPFQNGFKSKIQSHVKRKTVSTRQLVFPTTTTPITSEFGWRTHPITRARRFHAGIDFAMAMGAPIYAVDAGRVEFAGKRGGYGNTVIIRHRRGKSTLYAHASKLYVASGEKVARGQMIAAVGTTGFSTGPHLHFEVIVNDKPVNPRLYLEEQFSYN